MLKFQKKSKHETKTCILGLVNSLDFFGQPPFFRILKRQKFNTLLGHFLTVILMIMCALYLYFQFQDLLDQRTPNIIISETQPFNTPAFPLYSKNFTFVIIINQFYYIYYSKFNKNSIQYIQYNNIEFLYNISIIQLYSITGPTLASLTTFKKHFDITMSACNRTRFYNETKQATDVSLICRNVPLESCDLETHLTEEYQKKFFGKFLLKNMFCINKEFREENPPQLQGFTSADMDRNIIMILLQIIFQ